MSPILSGLMCRCPNCGKGRLFKGFLGLPKKCNACDLDYEFVDSGDGPAVFIILLVGFVVVASALAVEILYRPPYWVHAALWLPATLILSLGLLRPFKGLLIALQFQNKARQGELAKD